MSQHHGPGTDWTSTDSYRWRKAIKALLPRPCTRCGMPVLPTQLWDVDHIIPLHIQPVQTKSYATLAPAHRSCNRRHGGKAGSAITNARRAANKADEKGIRPW